ncbi:MAG: AMP-binding protein [Syntrophales bacterium]|jgi:crotonobetaine/carnitine-CoA ligase|nr:AMP-binding protein [Syntrophales bacterium]MDY0043892.1 AMP-binding protein [Syntrophales bacterium]
MDLEILKKAFEEDSNVVYKLYEYANSLADKKFLYYGEERQHLTFAEFNRQTNKIAHSLISMGVKKGDRISLYLFNPMATVLMMFGCWKMGAIFSPINFNYKGRLLSYQINDTAPIFLVTEQGMLAPVKDVQNDLSPVKVILRKPKKDEHDYNSDVANISLDSKFECYDFEELFKGEVSDLDTEINYWDTANIIYTSGTTGPAKGVVQSHRWMAQYTFNTRRFVHEDDVMYNDLPMYHVGGAISNFTRVVWRASKIAMWDKFSPKDFWNRIEESQSNNTTLLDVMVPWLMNAPERPSDHNNPLKMVHMQPLPQYHNKVAKRFGIDFITGGYGQTEAGNGFVGLFDELDEGEGTPAELYKGYSRKEIVDMFKSWGYPVFKGTDEIKKGFMGRSVVLEATVLNEHDEELGPGQYGQLAFRNRLPYCMLDGYYNKPEATVEVFRNLWFHTGDACYKDENGIFYFVDRMGGFIRTKGENISSYQVEDIINSHPKIQICAALPIPAADGEEDDIVVYASLEEGASLTEKELREWLAQEMPKFMWPKHIRFLDSLPRTATNKIEKYKLKQMILGELEQK